MQLTLAPIPFYWPRETVLAFYQQVADWPVDRVVVGENVCSKRRQLKTADWLSLAQMLREAGKEVAISTLALLEAESELKTVQRICQQHDIPVEANDFSAVEALYQQGVPFSAGPFLNIYNPQTLALLNRDGLERWTLPVELGKDTLNHMLRYISEQKLAVKTEVMAHGYLPLALSARCFTARALEKPKDDCQKVCIDYPTGITVDSRENQRLFTMNGIQTLSGDILDLLPEIPDMQTMGVDAIRLSPSQPDMAAIVNAYANTLQTGHISTTPESSAGYCNGYWFGEAGIYHLHPDSPEII